LRDRAGKLALGIDVERVDLMATPPRQAQEAFQAVIKARLEAGKAVAESKGIAARLANEALGESDRRLAEAQTYRTRVVSETVAQVARFKAVLARYRDNPQIIFSLMRQETVSRALASTGERFILPAGGKGDELRVTIPRQPAVRGEGSNRQDGP
jgi:membrane protease subunit HflK